jgi:16S rRNA (cytosine967-C5)-methyltransferase
MARHEVRATRGRAGLSQPPPAAGSRRPPPRRTRDDDVRVAAAWVVERTLASRAPVDSFLDSVLARYDERDQALLRELVLGTLRWLRRIDQVIGAASSRALREIEPALLAPLRVAAYQLLFLDRIPAHAAVDEAVGVAHQLTHRGGAAFVNAVLRRIARQPQLADWPVAEADPARRLAIELAHPDFLVRRWIERFGFEVARAVAEANNRAKPIHVLAFRDRGGRELLAEALIDAGLEVEPSHLSPLGLVVRAGNPLATEPFRRGDLYIQDEASQAAAWLPPPRPGERVLDAAAAPGGKGLALLAWEPTVRLVSADVSLPRLERLRANLARLGRRHPLVVADAGAPALARPFERVVLDLPCSGTGTLRKHPELKWRVSEAEIARLAAAGEALLEGSRSLVGKGGLLIVVTCSLEAEENEQVIARFAARHPEFRFEELGESLPPPLGDGLAGPGFWRLLPGGDHDGFTVQALRRRL